MKFISFLAAIMAPSSAAAMPGNPSTTTFPRRDVSQPWAGAVQEGSGWNFVTGTLTVPEVDGQDPSRAVAMWVGIDGLSCQNAIWQTGLTFYGDGSIDNWFEWWPIAPSRYSQPFAARPGDRVRMTVNAWSTTSGNATLENLTTGQRTYQEVNNMRHELCLQDADWIVEDFEQRSLANFGTISFTDTWASGRNGRADASGSRIVEVVADNRQRTRCGSDSHGVQCTYLN